MAAWLKRKIASPTPEEANAQTLQAIAMIDGQMTPITQSIQRAQAVITRLQNNKDLASVNKKRAAAKEIVESKQRLASLQQRRDKLQAPLQAVQDTETNLAIVGALSVSQKALASVVKKVDVDRVTDIVDRTDEAIEDSRTISQALGAPALMGRSTVAESDIDAVLAEVTEASTSVATEKESKRTDSVVAAEVTEYKAPAVAAAPKAAVKVKAVVEIDDL